MADRTAIEWTSATWNPITGCSIKSPGCANCYAMRLAGTRLRNHPSRAGLIQTTKAGPVWTGELRFNEDWLDQPVRWLAPRDIFVCAHADMFHEAAPEAWIHRIIAVMMKARQHRFQILTKRPDVMERIMGNYGAMSHIWLGTSVERQREADERRSHLASMARYGWNTWVSYEPALGPVDWSGWQFTRWLVSGGESGPHARPSHPDWHRAARDFCLAYGIAYFFKQWGDWFPVLDRDRDDPDWRKPYSFWELSDRFRFLNLAGACGFHGERLHVLAHSGKKAAGAMLDGVAWRQRPELT